jgi:DNA adenine methylase
MKPPLKWVGGKGKLLPELRKRMPEKIGRYFEPFFGGGALFFDALPQVASINDINADLVNVYRQLVDQLDDVLWLLGEHKKCHVDPGFYDLMRARFNENDFHGSPKKILACRAAAFIYLNKTCFNGLYRVNLDGKFNVPKGKYKNPAICNEKALRAASEALVGAQLTGSSFEESSCYATRGDFVYFDPPYVPVSRTSSFTSYTDGGFGITEQHLLADHARTLKRRGVKVMLSNSDTQIVRELYQDDFVIETVMAGRAINSKATARGKVREVIIRSYS